jgi:hypothetical protein
MALHKNSKRLHDIELRVSLDFNILVLTDQFLCKATLPDEIAIPASCPNTVGAIALCIGSQRMGRAA